MKNYFTLAVFNAFFCLRQIIKVQEFGNQTTTSMQPVINCELYGCFVDSYKIGDKVKLSGIYCARPKKKHYKSKVLLSIFTKSFVCLHLSFNYERPSFNEYLTPLPHDLDDLLSMIAPAILDTNDIKMGFLFSLIGGMTRNKTDKEIEAMSLAERKRYMDTDQFRGPCQINTLIIGNPSCGKSQVQGCLLCLSSRY